MNDQNHLMTTKTEYIDTLFFEESHFNFNCNANIPGRWIYETSVGRRVCFADEFEVDGDMAVAVRLAEKHSGLKCPGNCRLPLPSCVPNPLNR